MWSLVLTSLAAASIGIPEREKDGRPHLRSESVFVRFADDDTVLLTKNPDQPRPIASVTKLMSALVFATRHPLPSGTVTLVEDDKDKLKHSRSRIPVGRTYAADALLTAALAASDNRAVYALVRGAGMERARFVDAMNEAARALGMTQSRFADPAGLDPSNVSTARELTRLLDAITQHPDMCRRGLEQPELVDERGRTLRLGNTNRLARSERWTIVAAKTGYTIEAGRNLALRTIVGERVVDMVFLGAREMQSIFGDAGRVRRWLVERMGREPALAVAPQGAARAFTPIGAAEPVSREASMPAGAVGAAPAGGLATATATASGPAVRAGVVAWASTSSRAAPL
jgi:D-alanyl-D-alanine endopeptidase (penicillin-binding protein 7)